MMMFLDNPVRIKLFTHTDLDGYGCRILAHRYFNTNISTLDVTHVDYGDVDQVLHDFLVYEGYTKYDYVFITDIHVNEDTAKLIDNIVNQTQQKIILIDHHKTALHLNNYSWAIVKVEHNSDKLASGTSLFYDYLKTDWNIQKSTRDEVFVEMVRKYDTWEWKTKYNDEFPKLLNDLLYIYGGDRFVRHIIDYLTRHTSEIFGNQESLVLNLEQERIDKYVTKKNKSAVLRKIDDYNVLTVLADQYKSELGMKLAQMNPEADIIAMVDIANKSISFRTIKDGVDVSEFAKKYGGGGHAKASGAPIQPLIIANFLNSIFS